MHSSVVRSFDKIFNQFTVKRHLACFQSFFSVLEVEQLNQKAHEFLTLKFILELLTEAVPVKTPIGDM